MDITEKKLQANINKIFLLNATWMFLVLMPVIVPFFQSYGLDMERIYTLLTIYAISVVLLEVPSGYVSDLLGRKNTLVLAGLFQGVGFTILASSETFAAFVVFELANAVAISLFSGTDVALIYDTMEQVQKRKLSEIAILGRRTFYAQVGETIAALVGGTLAAVSLLLPAVVNAATGWMSFLIALTLYEPPRTKMSTQTHLKNFHFIYVTLFQQSKLLRLIILNYVSLGMASYIVVWAFQAYWKAIDIPLPYFGYLWAAYNLTVAVVARMAHEVERKLGSVRTLVVMMWLPVLGFLGMAYFASAVGVVLGLAFKISRGLNQVIIKDALNARVPANMRATANSISSLGVRLVFAGLGPVMGFMMDHQGYSFAFYAFACFYIVLFFILGLPLIRERGSFRPV